MTEECDLALAILIQTIKKRVELGKEFSAAILINSPEVKTLVSEPWAVSGIDDFMLPYITKFVGAVDEIVDKILGLELDNCDLFSTYADLISIYESYVDICAAFRFRESCIELKRAYDVLKHIRTSIIYQFRDPIQPPNYGNLGRLESDDDLPF